MYEEVKKKKMNLNIKNQIAFLFYLEYHFSNKTWNKILTKPGVGA